MLGILPAVVERGTIHSFMLMKNFHYPKPVRCFRIGNPADTTSYSIVTLKGKQTLPAMEELIRLLRESA